MFYLLPNVFRIIALTIHTIKQLRRMYSFYTVFENGHLIMYLNITRFISIFDFVFEVYHAKFVYNIWLNARMF